MKDHHQTMPLKPGADLPKPFKRMPGACCRKDLINLYGVTYKTLSKWLRPMASELGPIHGHYFTAAQLKVIFDTLGHPGE